MKAAHEREKTMTIPDQENRAPGDRRYAGFVPSRSGTAAVEPASTFATLDNVQRAEIFPDS
jgi:hypothetical protein